MLPGSLVMAFTSPFAGKIYDRLGIRKLSLAGSVGMFFSCAGLSFLSDSTSLSLIAVLFTLRSFSIACIMMPMVTWGMSTLDHTYTAHGTAIITTLRTIAGAISTAVFVSIMTAAGVDSMIRGIRFALSGVSVLAAILCVIVIFLKQNSIKS